MFSLVKNINHIKNINKLLIKSKNISGYSHGGNNNKNNNNNDDLWLYLLFMANSIIILNSINKKNN